MSYTDYMEGLGFNMDMTRALTGQPVTPETSQPATAVPLFDGMQSFSEANPDLVGMPTEQKLMGAMRNAHNAGDTAAAKRFAGMIQKVRNPNEYSKLAQASDNLQGVASYLAEGLLRLPQVGTDALMQQMGNDVSQGYSGSGEELLNRFNAAADVISKQSEDMNFAPSVTYEQVKDNPTPSNILAFMGEGLIGSLPHMALASVSAPVYFSSYVAPIALERAKNNGRDVPTPGDVAAAMVTALGIATAERLGVKAIFGKGVTGNIATRPIKSGLAEAGTEAVQNPLEYAGQTLGTDAGFDPAVAIDQAGAGALGGFGAGTGIRGTIDVANAIADPSSMGNPANQPDDPQAAADFARDIQQRAQEEGMNLKDVSKTSSGGARAVLDLQHGLYDEDMKRLRNVLKEQLELKDTDPELVQIDKMLAQLAYREARTKTKNIVGQREFAAVDRLVGNTKEGSELINVMRKTNELTKLHNAGFQGGVSQFTDQLAPFGVGIGYDRGAQKAEMLLRPLISGGIATNTGGMSLLGQTAAVGAGRAIDAVTGNRSRVNKYVNKNRKRDGMTSLTEPSMLEQARALEEANILATAQSNQREQERRQDAFIRGNLPAAGSPEATMIIATGGLPTEVIMEIARDVAARDPNLAQPARDFIDSVTGQRPADAGDFEGLTGLIREIKTVATNNPEYSKLANPQLAAQLSENYTTPVPAMGSSTPTGVAPAPRDVSAGYVRGIEANREAADRLADEVSNDTTISPRDKVVLLSALEDLRGNLGLDPVNKAQQVGVDAERQLSDPALADKYLMPYINRVAGQQENDVIANEMAVPLVGEGLSIFPKTKALYNKIDGIEVDQGNYQAGTEDVTGNSYGGARVYITDKGRGALEVDPEQTATPNKAEGTRWHSNLVRPNLYEWVDNPENMPQSFIVTVDHNKEGHQFALQYEADVPTELYRKPLRADGTKQDEPTMRPRGFGELEYGRKIGEIKVKSSGRIAPIYDTIRIVPKQQDVQINESSTPILSQPNGEQLSTEFNPTDKTEMGFLPFLRVRTDKKYDHPRKILASSNPKNAARQIDSLDQLLADHPNTLASPDAFMDYLADAMGKANKDGSVPLIPFKALEMVQNPQMIVEQIGGLTPGQRELAADGFSAAEKFREAYESGSAHADITGKLLLWGILSRGVSPYIQEGMFLDIVTDRGNKSGIGKHIQKAADGTFDVKEYLKWVNRTVPENTPGAGSTHNLNAFGETLLRKMSIKDPETGITPMQRLHDMMASDMSGRDVRREFHKLNTGVGINNKVLSFMLLVAGRNDVMVLDRIQFRNMFDDGRFEGFNIYDPTKIDKKQIAGSSIQKLGDDTMGLMIYEALERDLAPTVQAAYEQLGRGADFSMGRYHWESWVASSAQEVDHGTISGIINEAMGLPNPYDHIITREGRYNRFDSGAVYGYNPQTGQPYIQLPDGLGNMFEFTPDGAAKVLDRIRKKKKSDGIIPKDFSVSESLEGAYYDRPEVNKENLSKVLKEEGGQLVSRGVQETSESYSVSPGDTPVSADNILTPRRRGIPPSRAATPAETRDQLQIAQAILDDKGKLEIGKEGSPFENGIQDVRVAELLAKAMDIGFQIYDTPKQFYADLHERFRTKPKTPPKNKVTGGMNIETIDGRFITDLTTGQRYASFVALQAPFQSKKNKDNKITLGEHILSAFHELGHGIEGRSEEADPVLTYSSYPDQGKQQPVGGAVRSESLRDYITQIAYVAEGFPNISPVSKIKYEGTREEAIAIIDELNRMQSSAVLTIGGEQVAMRRDYEHFRKVNEELDGLIKEYENAKLPAHVAHYKKEKARFAKLERDNQGQYLRIPAERGADPISMFFVAPKQLKSDYPAVHKMLRDFLNSPSSPTSGYVKFYSAPFAAVLATIMATLLVAEREEEEKKGALALGQGALSV